jgi:hypothetical protein
MQKSPGAAPRAGWQQQAREWKTRRSECEPPERDKVHCTRRTQTPGDSRLAPAAHGMSVAQRPFNVGFQRRIPSSACAASDLPMRVRKESIWPCWLYHVPSRRRLASNSGRSAHGGYTPAHTRDSGIWQFCGPHRLMPDQHIGVRISTHLNAYACRHPLI